MGRPASRAGRVLLCSGRIYFDLEKVREDQGREDIAILRLEQLYPLTEEQLVEALLPYRRGTPAVWVQDEPENMCAWRHLKVRFENVLRDRWPLSVVSRHASASPATGSGGSHRIEQQAILDQAFAATEVPSRTS
jgi:2-oxoglutarate dehydrogenase E1 component